MERSKTDSQKAFASGGARSHKILIILSLIYMSDYADRMIVGSMINFIKADWGITDAEAGWLGSVVTLFITVFTIPSAILIDRWSRRKMVAIMTFFWSLATLSCAFTKTFTQLLIARAFIGIGEAGYAPGGSAILAGAYPEEKRAKILGIWNASIPLGIGIGMAAGGFIAKKWGWHHAFGIVAFPGMILAVFAWFMPDYKSLKPEESALGIEAEGNYIGHTFIAFLKQAAKILTIPSLALTYMGFAMNVSATTALSYWLPAYFERIGFAEQGRGGALATPIFALVLVGAPLGGYISDKWFKTNKKARLLLPAITSMAASLFLVASTLSTGNKAFALPMLLIFGVLVMSFVAPAAAVTQDVVHPSLRAFSYGMCVIVQHILGDVWSTPLVGYLSDMIGLDKALMFVPIYGVLGAMFFYAASKFYESDLAKVAKVELVAE